MKKVLSITIMLLVIGCKPISSKYGQGGENACQYVKEQVPGLHEDIASIEVIEEDSLLSDVALAFDRVKFAKAGSDFWQDNISNEDYMKIIDERMLLLKDIQDCWQFPLVVNDSLHKLRKYDSMWRKVYTVRVTMKSGIIKEPRVMMDNDGLTPYILERDFGKKLEEYERDISQAIEDSYTKR